MTPVEQQRKEAELRDQFAMAAIPALVMHCADLMDYSEIVAKRAYQIADAMLAERAKK